MTLNVPWQRHALQLERLLLRIVERLQDDEIEVRVLKGPALAHTVYDDPAHRVFGDLDLLVRSGDLERARRTILELVPGSEALPELRPGFDAEFAKDVLVRLGRIEIDLHRTIAAGPFGLRIPLDELFSAPTPFTVGARSLATLAPVPLLLQVAYNAALGDVPPRLSALRDVAQVHRVLAPELPTDAVLTSAGRWGGLAVLARAVDAAWTTLALAPTELSTWAHAYRPGPLDRMLLGASTSSNRSYTRQVVSLAVIDGWRAKGRYLRAIADPSPAYLEARGWQRTGFVRGSLARLRPRRRGG